MDSPRVLIFAPYCYPPTGAEAIVTSKLVLAMLEAGWKVKVISQADTGIADSCTWMGRLPWDEAMGCLGLMDIVVVPSRFEGFGLTAIEAMACRKPVVASRVDGLAEIIQNGQNGFLVPSEDIEGLADCIVELIKDEARRTSIGEAARKGVEEKYAYPMFRERIRALYEAVRRKAEG